MDSENEKIFKSYLRGLLRQLQNLKNAIHENNLKEAETLVDELINDTTQNIES